MNTGKASYRTRILIGTLAALLLLSACRQSGADPVPPTDAAATPVARATATETPPEPTPRPTATPTPEPTPIVPAAAIPSQTLDEDAVLRVDSVALPEAGWLAIFTVPAGDTPERLAGAVFLEAGIHEDLTVPLEVGGLTTTVVGRLYLERENPDSLDWPAPDEPVSSSFGVPVDLDLSALRPSVEVADQAVGRDGLLRIDSVRVLVPSWLLIHADEAGPVGPVLGKLYLEPGIYEELLVGINWREATPTLYAVFHEDDDRIGLLDYPAADLPLVVGDGPVLAEFAVGLPPVILVYDQPLVDGKVVVERVISDGPGWITIQADDGTGQPGISLGSSPLVDGLNQQVEVELDEFSVTSQLFARLHEDTEPGDGFNYPNADPPVLEDGRLPKPAIFFSDPDSHLMIEEQDAADGQIVVALVVAMQDTWVVVRADAEGAPGEVLGRVWIPTGISRDVVVDFDAAAATDTLYVVLHRDRGEPQEFEFPTGGDDPLLDNSLPIAVPFVLRPPVGDSSSSD